MAQSRIAESNRAVAVRASVVLAAAIIAVAAAGTAAAGEPAARPSIFGSTETRSSSLSKFKKWNNTLQRYAQEAPGELKVCQPTPSEPCHVARWRIFLKQIANLPKKEQLKQVNAYMNRWAYKIDPEIWNRKDYWATPSQFMYRTGDCEDYAISKFVSLIHLGFSRDEMRIVVLQDLNLKIPHAILVVFLDGEPLVLDNQIKQVVHASRIRHYKPIYSINERHWWLHRG